MTEKKNPKNIFLVLISAVFFSFTLSVYAPFEMVLNNRSSLELVISDVFLLLAATAVVATSVLFVVGLVFKEKGRFIYSAVLCSLAVVSFIQGMFLNTKIGPMNGEAVDWERFKNNFLLTAIIWIVIFVAVLFLLIKKSDTTKLIKGISIIGIAIQIIILLAVNFTASPKKVNSVELTDKNLLSSSTSDGVVVFVLDSLDDRHMKNIILEDSSITERFDGFTYFSNQSGLYTTTWYALPFIMTGEIYLNQDGGMGEGINTAFNNSVYLDRLIDAGYEINLFTKTKLVSDEFCQKTGNAETQVSKTTNHLGLIKEIYRFASCKYLPNILKPYVWMSTEDFLGFTYIDSKHNVYEYSEKHFYDQLKKYGLTPVEEKLYSVIHTKGAHPPYIYDENNELIEDGSVTPLQMAKGSINQVLHYIDEMKEKGTYDCNTIVIMADHGYYTCVPTNPIMMIKPAGSKGKMTENTNPTWQRDLHITLANLLGIDNEGLAGMDMYGEIPSNRSDRIFYSYTLEYHSGKGTPLRVVIAENNLNAFEGYKPLGYVIDIDGKEIPLDKFHEVELDKKIDLTKKANAKSLFSYGIGSSGEGFLTRVAGGYSRMSFYLKDNIAKTSFSMVMEYAANENTEALIDVYCNGKKVVEAFELTTGSSRLEFEIPEILLDDGKALIEIYYTGLDYPISGEAANIGYLSFYLTAKKEEQEINN